MRGREHLLPAAIACSLAALAACATNPVTGERQLALISEEQEIAIGRQAAAEIPESLGLVEDKALQDYVSRIGLQLARDSERPALPWSFAVVDDPTPNAFALPGGFIFVTRGMLNLMSSEAQLASVLGHEIGHVTARHSVTQISQQQLAQLGLGIGGILVPGIQPFGQALGTGLQLLFLKHGRDAERQADELGFKYARRQGYDLSEMARVFASLERLGGEQRSALPAWLSTHPSPGSRVEQVEAWLKDLPPPERDGRTERAAYLERIDGLIYGSNPRQGFFRDGVFYHPDLRFRFSLPSGWQGQNLSRAVMAVSPNQDAAVQLVLAPGSPAAAARQFLSQQGIRALQSSEQRVNGLPAIVSIFDAATDQGQLRGVVAHIGHGDRTYQLLGYTPAGRFDAYRPLFEQVIRSFGPVDDPDILNVRPRRIDVVRLQRPMTLDEFARKYDSAVDVKELAIINQVADANEMLPAGALVKRVVS